MGDPVSNPDLILICKDETMKAHSVFLAARSPFFKPALSSPQSRKSRVLKVGGCVMKTLKTVVHFIYGEDIADNLSSLDLVRLLEFNEKFLVQDLTEAVSKLFASKLLEEGTEINRLDEIIGMLYSQIKDGTLLDASILYDVYSLIKGGVRALDGLKARILEEVTTIQVTLDELPILFNSVKEYELNFSEELCKPIALFLKANANVERILNKLCVTEENPNLINSKVLVEVYDLVQSFIHKEKAIQESESAAGPLIQKILETISISQVNPANLPGLLIATQGSRGHYFSTALSSAVKKYFEEIPAKNMIVSSALELDINYLVPTLNNMLPNTNIPGLLLAYKKFLAIKVLCGDTACPQKLSPSPLVDQVWHLHLQHPGLYLAACRKIGEGLDFIDHNPSTAEDDSYKKLERLERTKIAYKLLFGYEALKEFWSWSSLKPGAGGGEIFVKGLTGKTLVYAVRFDESIEETKMRIEYREGIPAGSQRLIFAGRQLENGCSLLDYQISIHSTLQLVLRLSGC